MSCHRLRGRPGDILFTVIPSPCYPMQLPHVMPPTTRSPRWFYWPLLSTSSPTYQILIIIKYRTSCHRHFISQNHQSIPFHQMNMQYMKSSMSSLFHFTKWICNMCIGCPWACQDRRRRRGYPQSQESFQKKQILRNGFSQSPRRYPQASFRKYSKMI